MKEIAKVCTIEHFSPVVNSNTRPQKEKVEEKKERFVAAVVELILHVVCRLQASGC